MFNEDASAYVLGVTEAEFWARVGSQLKAMRLRAGYDRTYTAYRAGAPATATLNDIEEGRIGNLDSLSAYCQLLNVSLVDVFRAAIGTDEPTLNADARWVAEMFQEGPDDDARKGMLALARAQSAQLATAPAAQPVVPVALPATARANHGRGRTARGRR